MTTHESKTNVCICQIQSVPNLAKPGEIVEEPLSPRKRIKLALKRQLGMRTKKRLKSSFNIISGWFTGFLAKIRTKEANLAVDETPLNLTAGDLVRIRSKEEIKSTLDFSQELKGCSFMKDMWGYCGSVHRVLKPVWRFVDERDYRVKRTSGVVLLENVNCEGTELFGRCDRACFFFWREEWLEKLEENSNASPEELQHENQH